MVLAYWISLCIIVYTYFGYGVIISILAKFKSPKNKSKAFAELPKVTLLIAAYNEEEIIEDKIRNSLSLDYPKDKVEIAFVTDGSDDKTVDIIQKYPELKLFHSAKRAGKIAAVNRVMTLINQPITVFSDANVMINKEGLKSLVEKFADPKTGAVSGEKVVISSKADGASSSGEGFYWRYESYLKKCDAQWNTLVGSAGEFFGIRTALYAPINENTLIEDFVMTMELASKGFKVDYADNAIAAETGSLNIEEETKRKVRISAGGIQAVILLTKLLNPFKYGKLSFQYISHRALRWTLMPLAIVMALVSNLLVANGSALFSILLLGQIVFYGLALIGYLVRNKKTKLKVAYIPYYFIYMHYCVVLGWIKYFSGKQKVTWDKAKRAGNLQPTTN